MRSASPTASPRTFGRSALRLLVAVGVLLTGLGIGAGTASAHRFDESYLYLDVGDSTLAGRVEMPYGDLRTVFGYELADDADAATHLAELEADLPALQAYAADRTAIGANGVIWPLDFDGIELLDDDDVGDGRGYLILPFTAEVGSEGVPQMLEVTFTPFLAEIENRNNITLVANDWKRGVVEEEANELLFHTRDAPSGTIDLGDPSQWRNFRTSIDLGLDHIRTGPDHIFFVMVLLLPSVLVLVAGRWRPAERFGSSLLRVVIVATMFTIAHSITFTLAGLDLLPLPPSKLVETLIALSIAAAAIHNIKPILGHREWAIAFVFGLFHGMGFAGLVADLDISRSTQLVSLLGRNVGIEIGQLVIILITFPLLFVLRRTRAFMPLFYASSATLAALSLVWVYERTAEVDVGIDTWIDRAVLWPRSFYVMAVLTAIGSAYYLVERNAGRLLPTAAEHADSMIEGATDDADESDDEIEPEPATV